MWYLYTTASKILTFLFSSRLMSMFSQSYWLLYQALYKDLYNEINNSFVTEIIINTSTYVIIIMPVQFRFSTKLAWTIRRMSFTNCSEWTCKNYLTNWFVSPTRSSLQNSSPNIEHIILLVEDAYCSANGMSQGRKIKFTMIS